MNFQNPIFSTADQNNSVTFSAEKIIAQFNGDHEKIKAALFDHYYESMMGKSTERSAPIALWVQKIMKLALGMDSANLEEDKKLIEDLLVKIGSSNAYLLLFRCSQLTFIMKKMLKNLKNNDQKQAISNAYTFFSNSLRDNFPGKFNVPKDNERFNHNQVDKGFLANLDNKSSSKNNLKNEGIKSNINQRITKVALGLLVVIPLLLASYNYTSSFNLTKNSNLYTTYVPSPAPIENTDSNSVSTPDSMKISPCAQGYDKTRHNMDEHSYNLFNEFDDCANHGRCTRKYAVDPYYDYDKLPMSAVYFIASRCLSSSNQNPLCEGFVARAWERAKLEDDKGYCAFAIANPYPNIQTVNEEAFSLLIQKDVSWANEYAKESLSMPDSPSRQNVVKEAFGMIYEKNKKYAYDFVEELIKKINYNEVIENDNYKKIIEEALLKDVLENDGEFYLKYSFAKKICRPALEKVLSKLIEKNPESGINSKRTLDFIKLFIKHISNNPEVPVSQQAENDLIRVYQLVGYKELGNEAYFGETYPLFTTYLKKSFPGTII